MTKVKPKEIELLTPVLRLFPKKNYYRYIEVPLGRRRIDVLCVSKRHQGDSISIVLKVEDWRTALWQAVVNFQVSEQSYIAIWHEYSHRGLRESSLLYSYGIGLIEVRPRTAQILTISKDHISRIARSQIPHANYALASTL